MIGIAALLALGALGGLNAAPKPRSAPSSKQVRTPADILRRREKQDAKRARRAARARQAKP